MCRHPSLVLWFASRCLPALFIVLSATTLPIFSYLYLRLTDGSSIQVYTLFASFRIKAALVLQLGQGNPFCGKLDKSWGVATLSFLVDLLGGSIMVCSLKHSIPLSCSWCKLVVFLSLCSSKLVLWSSISFFSRSLWAASSNTSFNSSYNFSSSVSNWLCSRCAVSSCSFSVPTYNWNIIAPIHLLPPNEPSQLPLLYMWLPPYILPH